MHWWCKFDSNQNLLQEATIKLKTKKQGLKAVVSSTSLTAGTVKDVRLDALQSGDLDNLPGELTYRLVIEIDSDSYSCSFISWEKSYSSLI